jgi:hypothetical protein
MRALQGYALARRTLDKVVPFPVDRPASVLKFRHDPFLFPPPGTVKVLSFDAHFGVHRHVHKDFRPSRTVALRGRPKKKQHHKGQITYLHMRQGKAS